VSDRADDRHCDTCQCDNPAPAWDVLIDVFDLYIECGNQVEAWLGSDDEPWDVRRFSIADDGRVLAHVRRFGSDEPTWPADASRIVGWDHA